MRGWEVVVAHGNTGSQTRLLVEIPSFFSKGTWFCSATVFLPLRHSCGGSPESQGANVIDTDKKEGETKDLW